MSSESAIDITEEIQRLQARSKDLTESVFASLTPWRISRLARHPQRPYTLDYVKRMCTEFHELHGDRVFRGLDLAIVCGLAQFDGRAVALIGHQKGRNTRRTCYAISLCRAPRAIARRCG